MLKFHSIFNEFVKELTFLCKKTQHGMPKKCSSQGGCLSYWPPPIATPLNTRLGRCAYLFVWFVSEGRNVLDPADETENALGTGRVDSRTAKKVIYEVVV